nr:YkgJ family cysteine cluster protein [Vitreoscilla filiformis]
MTSLKFEPPFPCTRCGACCRSVHLSPLTKWLDKGDGVCIHFEEKTALCSIYEDRPEICRIDLHYEKNYKGVISWLDFCHINEQCCEKLSNQQHIQIISGKPPLP